MRKRAWVYLTQHYTIHNIYLYIDITITLNIDSNI